MKYTGDISDAISTVKRLYADLHIEVPCPECSESVVRDFNDDYILYGELDSINFYCSECEHEWEVPARIISAEITIEVDFLPIALRRRNA